MAKSNKETNIHPSLQPRKVTKKPIPKAKVVDAPSSTPPVVKSVKKAVADKDKNKDKKRFSLWLDDSVYRAFKVHVAMNGGSHSDYIEKLIKKDLKL